MTSGHVPLAIHGGSHLLLRIRGGMGEGLGPPSTGKLDVSVEVPVDMSPEVVLFQKSGGSFHSEHLDRGKNTVKPYMQRVLSDLLCEQTKSSEIRPPGDLPSRRGLAQATTEVLSWPVSCAG